MTPLPLRVLLYPRQPQLSRQAKEHHIVHFSCLVHWWRRRRFKKQTALLKLFRSFHYIILRTFVDKATGENSIEIITMFKETLAIWSWLTRVSLRYIVQNNGLKVSLWSNQIQDIGFQAEGWLQLFTIVKIDLRTSKSTLSGTLVIRIHRRLSNSALDFEIISWTSRSPAIVPFITDLFVCSFESLIEDFHLHD